MAHDGEKQSWDDDERFYSSGRDSDDSPILSYRYDRHRRYASYTQAPEPHGPRERRSAVTALAKCFLFSAAMILFCALLYIPAYNRASDQLPKALLRCASYTQASEPHGPRERRSAVTALAKCFLFSAAMILFCALLYIPAYNRASDQLPKALPRYASYTQASEPHGPRERRSAVTALAKCFLFSAAMILFCALLYIPAYNRASDQLPKALPRYASYTQASEPHGPRERRSAVTALAKCFLFSAAMILFCALLYIPAYNRASDQLPKALPRYASYTQASEPHGPRERRSAVTALAKCFLFSAAMILFCALLYIPAYNRASDQLPKALPRYASNTQASEPHGPRERRSAVTALAKCFLFSAAMILFCALLYIPAYNRASDQLPKALPRCASYTQASEPHGPRERRSAVTALAKCFLFSAAMILFCALLYIPAYNRASDQLPKGLVAGWSVHTNRDTKIYVQPNNVTLIHEPKDICSKLDRNKKNKLFLLIVVCSSTTNFERRVAIRETWGNRDIYRNLEKVFNTVSDKYKSYNYTYDLYPESHNVSVNVSKSRRDISIGSILPELAKVLQNNMVNTKTEDVPEKRFEDDDDPVLPEFDMNKELGENAESYDYEYESNIMRIPPRGYEDSPSLGKILKMLKEKDVFPEKVEEKTEEADNTEPEFKLVFLLGLPTQNNDTEVQSKIDEEVERYGDVIQEGFIDSYNNLTLKSIMMLKWITNKCNESVRYILKTDDDMYINVPKLMFNLKNRSRDFDEKVAAGAKDHEYLLIGALICGARPVLDSNNKWYSPRYMYGGRVYPRYLSGTGYVQFSLHVRRACVPSVPIGYSPRYMYGGRVYPRYLSGTGYSPRYMYGGRVYPRYLSGTGYALSSRAASALYSAALRTNYFHLEDIYITGMCAIRSSPRIIPRDDPDFSYRAGSTRAECAAHSHATTHRVSPRRMRLLHRRLGRLDLADRWNSPQRCALKRSSLTDSRLLEPWAYLATKAWSVST
ncbi:uncharacterized protein LOC135084772 [Ostrinia nubilalis]|uniref:uncharacterized protein LOC135084772 n=1 Tax=Ostrinia nubilalis TaxID=29057 RepID=UPI0030825674